MHEVIFYDDDKGHIPVLDYIVELGQRKDKESSVQMNKIIDYMKILSEYGTRAGEPYMKHLDGEIWELRPLRDRIMFAGWLDGKFVLLHHFIKKTQKTPLREIKQAKRELADFKERNEKNGK